MYNTKEVMRRHCGTNNRVPCTLSIHGPLETKVRPCAREESASPAWLVASAMNARGTANMHV